MLERTSVLNVKIHKCVSLVHFLYYYCKVPDAFRRLSAFMKSSLFLLYIILISRLLDYIMIKAYHGLNDYWITFWIVYAALAFIALSTYILVKESLFTVIPLPLLRLYSSIELPFTGVCQAQNTLI